MCRRMKKHELPTLDVESTLWQAGCHWVAGVDEAGRGALAGPVVAAALLLSPEAAGATVWTRVRDSKLLSPEQRETLEIEVRAAAAACAVGVVTAAVIDHIGIAAATRLAMQEAVNALQPTPDHLLIDWVRLPELNIAQICRPKADRDMVSVAAASIVAKVYRDRLMMDLDALYPLYGLRQHKGYGTAQHLAAIETHGPCAEHRRSFAPFAHQPSLFD
jgi:ribonuclease HII